MEYKNHPMIYLLISKKDNRLEGYYTNAELAEFYPFSGWDNLVAQLRLRVNEPYFEAEMQPPRQCLQKGRPTFSRLFVVEIMYQQHGDWQDCIHGLKCGTMPFKSREDLKEKLLNENIKDMTDKAV